MRINFWLVFYFAGFALSIGSYLDSRSSLDAAFAIFFGLLIAARFFSRR
ncbi:hypothetical protein [Aeromicrobium sp. UC242_57]